LMSNK